VVPRKEIGMSATTLTRHEHWRAAAAIVAARVHVARAMDTLAVDPTTPPADQPVLLQATHRRLSEIRSALITALALLEAYGTTHLATPRGHRPHPHPQQTCDSITAGSYDTADNPHDLQIAVHELHRVRSAIDQLSDALAETTATEDHRAAGLRAAKSLIDSLLTQAHHRHQKIVETTSPDPVDTPTETTSFDPVDIHLAQLVSAPPTCTNREPVLT
jgi:hypothetical protein